MKVGEKIKTIRELKKLSQEDMAHKLGLSVNGYARLERGESRLYIQVLEEIAQVLEMDITELLSVGSKSFVCVIGENSTTTSNIIICDSVNDKKMIDTLLKAKDEIINQQQQQIALLKELLEKSK